MDLATFIFWIVAIILVGSALLVVTQSNIVHSALALIVVFAMAGIIFAVTFSPHAVANQGNGSGQLPANVNNVVRIGQLLYSPTTYSYVLPFEIASLVLLVAIVGAIVIGRED